MSIQNFKFYFGIRGSKSGVNFCGGMRGEVVELMIKFGENDLKMKKLLNFVEKDDIIMKIMVNYKLKRIGEFV